MTKFVEEYILLLKKVFESAESAHLNWQLFLSDHGKKREQELSNIA